MSKYLGQHFLKNKEKIGNIVDALQLEDGDMVVEIGPGNGALMKEMLRRNKEVKIVGIEKDENLAEKLSSSRFVKENGIDIIRGDALEILPEMEGKYKLVGNIPYYITGHLLRILGEMEKRPELIVLTVQKEVAERLTAEPPKMNILAASVQFWGEANIIEYISKNDFRPRPEVDSAVVKIIPLDRPVFEKYYHTIKILFKHPRKTILNNLSDKLDERKELISEKIKELGLDPGIRPQNLSIEEIKKISEML